MEGRKGSLAVVLKIFFVMDKEKLMIDSNLFMQVFLMLRPNFQTLWLSCLIKVHQCSYTTLRYQSLNHFQIHKITVLCHIFPGKNPVKLKSLPSAKLPFPQTREVECKTYALKQSVGLIVRLCFKFYLTGPSRSMVLVIICKYSGLPHFRHLI